MKEKQNRTKRERINPRRKMIALYVITGILFVALAVISVLFYLQLQFVKKLVATAVDLIETEVLREAPDEVNRQEIKETFKRIRKAVPKGKVDFGKAVAAAHYAEEARNDEQWTAKEVDTLLHMMNISLKIDKEE